MLLYYILSAILGLAFGSYVSMAGYRLGIDQGQGGRSKCTNCSHTLNWKDLIPVVSYIMLKGRCRYCKASIGSRYPLIELITMAGFLLNYYYFQGNLLIVALLDLVVVQLMIIVVSDLRYKIIPDQSLILLAAIFIIYAYFTERPLLEVLLMPILMLVLALIVKYPMEWILKRTVLGMGDVKFFVVVGLVLPPILLASFLVLSGLCGLCFGLIWRYIKHDPKFPFGPAMCASIYYLLLTRHDIVAFLI